MSATDAAALVVALSLLAAPAAAQEAPAPPTRGGRTEVPTLVPQVAPAPPGTTIIRPYGAQYGMPDPDDPTRFDWVFLDGVEVEQGGRRMIARTLVAVLARGTPGGARTGGQPAPPGATEPPAGELVPAPDADGDGRPDAPPGFFIPDARLLELYLDGDVGLVEGDETISGAAALHVDNATGIVTVAQGELRATVYGDQPLIARYELMRRLQDGSARMEGFSYTSCDYDHPHWHVHTPWATLTPTDDGRILETGPNVIDLLDVPVLSWAGYKVNVDRDTFLLRRVRFGRSSRFGTEIVTDWGGDFSDQATGIAGLLGHEGKVNADWSLESAWYSKRGLFLQPEFTYRTKDSKGRLLFSYIHDVASEDHLGQPIDKDPRGRIDLEHRTAIGEHGTLDVEFSRQSDANYLNEYYEREFKEDKPQETYVSYREVVDNHAWRVLASQRMNSFDTQAEYHPDVQRHVVGDPFLGGFLTERDFVSNANLRQADGVDEADTQNVRAGSAATVDWPFDLPNGDRVTAQAGTSLTWFQDTIDDGAAFRYSTQGRIDWSRVYSGTSDWDSELWNFDGLRRIVEPRVGYLDRFRVNRQPEDLLQIDNIEKLDEQRSFELGLRDRIQTHQGGRVATVLDTDLRLLVYPYEHRDNNDETLGPLDLDTVWVPGANIPGLRTATVRWRASFDVENGHYTESFASYVSQLGEGTKLAVSNNKVFHEFNFVTVGLVWTLNPKWAIGIFHQEDQLARQKVRDGLLLRQVMHRWIMDIELSSRRGDNVNNGSNADDTRIAINLRPAIFDHDEDLTDQIGNRVW